MTVRGLEEWLTLSSNFILRLDQSMLNLREVFSLVEVRESVVGAR